MVLLDKKSNKGKKGEALKLKVEPERLGSLCFAGHNGADCLEFGLVFESIESI